MLERQLLLQSRGGGIDAVDKPIDTSDAPLVKHKELHLPPLCRRYNHLPLTSNWFLELLANQNKKRPHRKSHGLIPFKELAQTVAKNYREIDDDTQSFVNEVAERLGWHCEEMEVAEAKERRLMQEKESGPGSRNSSGGKKRKDAPVVSVAGAKGAAASVKSGSLSQDEAATVQQLMGMKAQSPTSAQPPGHPQGAHPSSGHPHRTHPSAVHTHPMMNYPSDSEAERLQIELARAMNSRRESERRIQLLKEQMTRHHAARAQQDQLHHRATQAATISPSVLRSLPAGYDQHLASLMAGSPPLASRSHPAAAAAMSHPHSAPAHSRMNSPESQSAAKAHPNSLQEMEKELLKEALARRLIPPGVPLEALYPYPGAHAALRGHPLAAHPHPVTSMAHPPQDHNDGGAPFKKRQRFTFDKSDGDDDTRKQAKESREEEGKEGRETDERAASEETKSSAAVASSGAARAAAAAAENRSAAHSDEIGFYKDLYAKLMPPRHHHAPNPSPRDLAFFDNLTHSTHSALGLGRSSNVEQAAQQALMENFTRGTRPNPYPPPHYPPPPHLAAAHYPPHPGASHGMHGHSYAALLSQMAAGRQHPAAHPAHATPPPIATAASHPLPVSSNAARATSASPPKQKSSLLEIVHAASRQSQFGLSYNDIMDVWKEMNRDNSGHGTGHGRGTGGEGGNDEEEGANKRVKKENKED